MDDAANILRYLYSRGVSISLSDDGSLKAWPAAHLTDEHRRLIRSNRDAIHDFIVEAHALTADLVALAMQASESWGDGPEAREQMRREVQETPAHLKGDLLEHFRSGKGMCANGAKQQKPP